MHEKSSYCQLIVRIRFDEFNVERTIKTSIYYHRAKLKCFEQKSFTHLICKICGSPRKIKIEILTRAS